MGEVVSHAGARSCRCGRGPSDGRSGGDYAMVSRKLAAVDSFFVFHARHDDSVRLCLTRWYPGGRRSFRPFLAHIQKGSRRSEIRLRGEAKPLPQVVTRDQVRQLLGACQAGSSAMMVV